ncbi:lactosylceramide 1,3-N-acetyl-beta-D-glucosaminyltransferase A-like [Babylonia areolata]|uniref:lactosylceramide 1,3-N-acetyl-beta-D-glucosaminyltransferase A-like n=1 Tax=Babylonia areolata TaxID=304850 RepID=UPI003FD60CBF
MGNSRSHEPNTAPVRMENNKPHEPNDVPVRIEDNKRHELNTIPVRMGNNQSYEQNTEPVRTEHSKLNEPNTAPVRMENNKLHELKIAPVMTSYSQSQPGVQSTLHVTATRSNESGPVSNNNHHRSYENMDVIQTKLSNAKNIVHGLRFTRSETYFADNASFFIPRKTLVNQFAVRWLIQTTCPPEGPVLLVVVPSVHSHTAHRTAIRETWGSPAYGHPWPGDSRSLNGSVKFVFFVGVSRTYNHDKLVSEAAAFNDIVVGDFLDSYQNLSLKMAMVLQWADLHCARAKYLLKVDEDTFVNVPLLLDVLSLVSQNNSHFVLGHLKANRGLSVARRGRWEVSTDAYPLPYWPLYLYGHSYVISGDAISSLRHVSQYMPLITNEDAYVTGVLVKSALVQRIHSRHFAAVWIRRRCDLVQDIDISQTGIRDSLIRHVWNTFKTGNCPAEF